MLVLQTHTLPIIVLSYSGTRAIQNKILDSVVANDETSKCLTLMKVVRLGKYGYCRYPTTMTPVTCLNSIIQTIGQETRLNGHTVLPTVTLTTSLSKKASQFLYSMKAWPVWGWEKVPLWVQGGENIHGRKETVRKMVGQKCRGTRVFLPCWIDVLDQPRLSATQMQIAKKRNILCVS